MTEILLVIILHLPAGSAIEGSLVHGFSPRPQPSMEACLERAEFAESVAPPNGVERVEAYCERIPEE